MDDSYSRALQITVSASTLRILGILCYSGNCVMRRGTLVHGFLCSTLMPRLPIGGTVDPVDPVETWFMQPPESRLAISDPWLAGVRLTAWTVRQVGVKGPRVENKGFKAAGSPGRSAGFWSLLYGLERLDGIGWELEEADRGKMGGRIATVVRGWGHGRKLVRLTRRDWDTRSRVVQG